MKIVGEVVKYGDLKPGDWFEEMKVVTPTHEPYEAELIGTRVLIRLDNEWPEWFKKRQAVRFTVEL